LDNQKKHSYFILYHGLPPLPAIPLGVGSKENPAQFFELLDKVSKIIGCFSLKETLLLQDITTYA